MIRQYRPANMIAFCWIYMATDSLTYSRPWQAFFQILHKALDKHKSNACPSCKKNIKFEIVKQSMHATNHE